MEQITSSSLAVQLKLKCLLKKPTHDDIIETKDCLLKVKKGKFKCWVFIIRQYIKVAHAC